MLFVHGFDPRGVKLPYSNFLKEFEKHKRLTGADGTVSPIEPPPADKPWLKRWQVSLSELGAEPVETVFDFLEWHTKPRIYCGLERDSQQTIGYLKEDQPECL